MVLKEFFSSEYWESWASRNHALIAAAFVQMVAPRGNVRKYASLVPGVLGRIQLTDFRYLASSCRERGFLLDRMPVINRRGEVADGNHRIAYCLVRGMPIIVRVEK